MSNINNAHKFTATAAFGAAAIFVMLSFGSSAEATNITSCQGATADQAMSCCENFVKKNERPLWMIQTRTSCHEATVCRGGKGGIIGIAAVVVKRAISVS